MALLIDYKPQLTAWVSSAGIMSEWTACREIFLDKLSMDFPGVIALPILACQAVGGTSTDAAPIAAAWSMLRYAADLLDAVQDGDHLPKHVKDPSAAIEYANGLIFAAYQSIATYQEPNTAHRLMQVFSDLAFQATHGQNLSQRFRRDDSAALENYWQAALMKSGSIFQAGLGGGAIVGKAAPDYEAALCEFGNALGIIRQIIDDCRDVFDGSDANAFEYTLPLFLLSEKLRMPISSLVSRFRSKDAFLAALNSNHIPEMIASVLLEWHRRGLENLRVVARTADIGVFTTILQDFATRPWLNIPDE